MQRIRANRRNRSSKALLYSFVFIMACGLIAAGMPRGQADNSLLAKAPAQDKRLGEQKGGGSISPDAPTEVRLHRFEAFRSGGAVWLEWQSGYELDNLGYNIYRELNGERVQLNPSLIAGSALQAGQGIVMRAGNSYAWRVTDRKPADNESYWLESIDLHGQSIWYGPVSAQRGKQGAARPPSSRLLADYSVESPRTEQREWPVTFAGGEQQRGQISFNKPTVSPAGQDSPELDQQWLLALQIGVKLLVSRDGWQRVSRAELLGAGLNPNATLANLQLYVGGVEQAIVVNADGSIEFYGQALDIPTTDKRVYWLVAGATAGKRVNVSSAGPFDPNVPASTFASTVERKDRTVRFPALLNGPGENFFGPVVGPSPPLRQTLQVSALDQASATQALLEVGLQGLTFQNHLVRVQVNGVDVGFINFDNRDAGSGQFSLSPTQLRENKNTITLTGTAPGADSSLVSYVRLTYPRRYEAASNRLLFGVPGGQAVKVANFSTSNIRVLDITDTANVKELTVSPQASGGGFAFTLPSVVTARTLLAFSGNNFSHPEQVLRNEPSSWHQTSNAADMLIITHGDFRQSLAPLRMLREGQGLGVAMVDVEDVYDEFSFGAHSPQALKDFVQRAKTQWQTGPRYLLLVGDATSDPRNYYGIGEQDIVPTMMVNAQFSESASDDAFADFDDDGLAELAVGRLPVKTAQQTTVIVNKIISYEQYAVGDTQQRGAVMVSDQSDMFYDFVAFTMQVRESLPPTMSVQFINRADGDTATIRQQIMTAINQGPGLVNYLGHGSVGVWTGEGLLAIEDAANMTNSQRLSIFVMMTCLNGNFAEVGTESLGEAVIETPTGGAVAAWTSSGLTIPYGQVAVSKHLYELLFAGQPIRLGDATKAAKVATADPDIRRLSILFGDPAMRFR